MAESSTKDDRVKKGRQGGGPSADAAAPWEVTCLCGERLNGERKKKAQIVSCPNCDRSVFVLPINRYTGAPRRGRRKKLRSISVKPALQGGGQIVARCFRWCGQGVVGGIAFCKQKTLQWIFAAWGWFTPLRTALIVLALIVLLTGTLGLRKHWHEQALQDLRIASQQAEQALQEQRWGEATEAYRRAAVAIGTLGRSDLFAQEILQKDRELQAIARLCPLTIEEMLLEATGHSQTVGSWIYTYETRVQNHWIIMVCWLKASQEAGADGFSLAQPMPIAGEWLNIRWPRALLANSPNDPPAPIPVICAGQIESLEKSSETGETWVLTIHPEQAFLWASPETCAAAGLELEATWLQNPTLTSVLEQQRLQVYGEEP